MNGITVLFATHNPGKLKELACLFADAPFTLSLPEDFGTRMPQVAETGATFAQNALLKARALACASGHWALADDSGLEVDVLGGAPGVNSARYAGHGSTDAQNVAKLLAALHSAASRRARFHCALTLAKPTGQNLTAEGVLYGEICDVPKGEGGFGYDPVFFLPQIGKTLAELSFDEKQLISHRSQAAARLKKLIEGF